MAKLYSTLFALLLFTSPYLIAQNVGIGTSTPREKLDVNGAIIIGNNSAATPNTGTIRYNPTTNKFEGRTNNAWVPFEAGGGESLWVPNGVNIYPDTQYNGNVGIGTYVPLAKLHVKGSGSTAIKAENTSATIPTVDVINTIGVAVRAKTNHDSLWAVEAINLDSSGYAIKLINAYAQDTINGNIVIREGGNAALLVGDLDTWGAIRNSDDDLYGGSVAINDGMTVGDIAGASCTPVNAVMDSFVKDFGASFQVIYYGRNNNPVYSNIKTFSPTKDCRSVTKYYFEPYVGDEQNLVLFFDIFVRDEFIGTVYALTADLTQSPPIPAYYWQGGHLVYYAYNLSLCGCYTSKWGFDSHVFDGEDPNTVASNNWYVQFGGNQSGDWDYLFGYKSRVYYMWGDTIAAPAYAAYGDIRASGSIYANSDDLLGDVAEYFKVSSARKPEIGDIVSISRDNPQTFELSNKEYDPLIAGVVSENPSVYLNKPTEGYPIGLTGRVKVKVNLLGGKIEVGDPITSSSVEGVGMRAGRDGVVIGYALESFDGSRAQEGKIVIMLSRGHLEKVDPSKVHEVESQQFGGILIKGATRVKENESMVFVSWDEKLAGRIPSDVEFEDLFIELTPFGGNAKMIVKDVNAEGITVEITERSAGFEGFYYQTDIVTAMMETLGGDEQPADNSIPENFEEKLARAKKLYKDWNTAFEELNEKGGMSLVPSEKMTSGKQAGLYKKEVVKAWQKNVPELFERWQYLGRELSQVVGNDQNLIRKMRDM